VSKVCRDKSLQKVSGGHREMGVIPGVIRPQGAFTADKAGRRSHRNGHAKKSVKKLFLGNDGADMNRKG